MICYSVPRALASIFLFSVLVFASHATVQAKDTWLSVESRNFHLVGNASEKDIKQVATRLEQFRDVFSRLFPNARLTSSVPTTVIVFKSHNSFKPYKPGWDGKIAENVSGYFQSGHDVNYIALSSESRSEDSFTTIFHEYVHLLLNNAFGPAGVPAWFNEGLAEYYSTFAIERGQDVKLGVPIGNHLLLLRSSEMIPFETLFAMDSRSIHSNSREAVGLFYAQSWALVHFLIQSENGKHLPSVGKFLELSGTGLPIRDAFQQAFGMDFAAAQRELKKYTKQEKYRIQIARFEHKLEFDAQMKVTPISEAMGLAYLGDLLAHTERLADAKVRLHEALKLEPNLPLANAALGLILSEEGKITEALPYLEKAASGNGADYRPHYSYAYALHHHAEREMVGDLSPDSTKTDRMRSELRKAIELKPDFAGSYSLLARINSMQDKHVPEAIELIKKAIVLSPGNEEYQFVLANIYLRQNDFPNAIKVVGPMATGAADPRVRAVAAQLLGDIKKHQEQWTEYLKQKAEYEKAVAAHNSRPGVMDSTTQNLRGPHYYIEEALRQPGQGEVRMQGFLQRLECSAKGIVFIIKGESGEFRVTAKDFDNMNIVSFANTAGTEITCGPRKDDAVVVTYKPSSQAGAKIAGEIVSLEFVPSDFKLRKN